MYDRFFINSRKPYRSNFIILLDYPYWSMHYDELQEWCESHQAVLSGMTVDFKNEKDMLLFTLRWA